MKPEELEDMTTLTIKTNALDNNIRIIKRLANGAKVMLFTTKTCPNCKIAYTLLDKANIGYEKIDAEAQEDLTMKYGIRQAPTLIVTDGDGYESFVNLSNIKKFIEQC
jgi:glutaredoxin